MKSSIRQKLDLLVDRLDEIDRMLSAPETAGDMEQFRKLSRERAELEPVIVQFNIFRQAENDLAEAELMRADPEMRAFAEEEIAVAKARLPELEVELQKLLLPKDPNDERSVLLEIRAGTGGDESALFAGDLFRMYSRYAERQRWQVEVMSASESELGGYREIICRIGGNGAYSRLKFESGGHRVQRVPETETQGRIHTSACTVAVMPEADEVEDVNLNPADLRIDTFRASGAGGQHINKTDSAVRITHIPTNIVVACQTERSQHQNRARAWEMLRARMYEAELQKREAAAQALEDTKTDIGWGHQIRSYVLQPYQMVKDLRTNVETSDTQGVLDGDLDQFMAASLAHRIQGAEQDS